MLGSQIQALPNLIRPLIVSNAASQGRGVLHRRIIPGFALGKRRLGPDRCSPKTHADGKSGPMADTEPSAFRPTGISAAPNARPRAAANLVVMIAGLMASNAFGIDNHAAALNEIAHAVGLTAAGARKATTAKQMIIFFLCAAIRAPKIIWAHISDRLGGGGPLFVALVGYNRHCFACIVMRTYHGPSDHAVPAGRVFLPPGGRLVAVSGPCRDLFAGRTEWPRFMSLVMTIFHVVRSSRRAIGQAVLLVAPWEAIFVVLAIFGIHACWSGPGTACPRPCPSAGNRFHLGAALGAYGQTRQIARHVRIQCALRVHLRRALLVHPSSEQVLREVFEQTDYVSRSWFRRDRGNARGAPTSSNSRIGPANGNAQDQPGSAIALHGCRSGSSPWSPISWATTFLIFLPICFALCFGCFGLMG